RLRRIHLLAPLARAVHRFEGLVELPDRLLRRIAALSGGRLRAALLLAGLAGLTLLAGLALLRALVALLPLLLTRLLLIRELLLQLLELPPELLRLAAQLLLLPAIPLGELLPAIRLAREVLLAPRELLQPADRLVDALGLLLGLVERDRRLRLVLILLEVHLELEELGQITAREPAAASAAALERDLNVGELRLGAQQVLKRLLLRRDRLVERDLRQALRSWVHRLGRELEALDELGDALVLRRELARACAARERARLLRERALHLGEHLRVVVELLLVEEARLLLVPLTNQVPRRDENLPLAARDLVLLAAGPAAASAAGPAPLREAALERLDLDEIQVALGRPA